MQIKFNNDFFLGSIHRRDKRALVTHLQEEAIHQTTVNLPYPYRDIDAETWINRCIRLKKGQKKESYFAIREPNYNLVGCIGITELALGETHTAEFGYWLAKPYWGKGLMGMILPGFIHYAFKHLELQRLTALVLPENKTSIRLLEKQGFQQEGLLRQHVKKGDEFLDIYCYGLLKQDFTLEDQ